jgi:HSP20 family protein
MMRSMDSMFGFPTRGFLDPFETTSFLAPITGGAAEFVPKIDVSENDKSIQVHAELPGLSKDSIKISVDNGVLEISGEKSFEKRTEDKKRKYHRVERSYGSFVRRLAVPRSTKASDVKAKFQNGVLELEVPKAAESKEQFEVKIE